MVKHDGHGSQALDKLKELGLKKIPSSCIPPAMAPKPSPSQTATGQMTAASPPCHVTRHHRSRNHRLRLQSAAVYGRPLDSRPARRVHTAQRLNEPRAHHSRNCPGTPGYFLKPVSCRKVRPRKSGLFFRYRFHKRLGSLKRRYAHSNPACCNRGGA